MATLVDMQEQIKAKQEQVLADAKLKEQSITSQALKVASSHDIISPWERDDPSETMTWNQALVQGAQNLPSSGVGVVRDLAHAVMHPIDTGMTILKLMQGTLHLVLPDEIQQRFDPEGQTEEAQEMARAVGQYFKDKYKDEDSIKHVIANDPASVLMDIATVLSGGGLAVAKTGQIARVGKMATTGQAMQKASTFVDPLVATAKGATTLTGLTALAAREMTGALSGTGGGTVGNLYDASRAGSKEGSWFSRGEEGQMATSALRGSGNLDNVLQVALRDLDVMKKQKQDNYRQNELLWKKDNTILNFEEITAALNNAEKMVKYQGTIKNPAGAKALDELRKIVDDWKLKPERTHHTPEGMDALKQRLWAVVETVPIENATAKGVAQNIYHSVKNTISKQAPGYAKAMKEYTDALDLIKEIEKTLSLNPKKGSVDTAIRKLNSIMRDNVNTNYGQRVKLARQLEDVGGEKFLAELAGQQFSSAMPRSIQGAVLPAMATTAVATGGGSIPGAMATLAMGSPRIVGEGANLTGYIMGKLDKLPTPSYEGIAGLLELLYQTQAQLENKQNQ